MRKATVGAAALALLVLAGTAAADGYIGVQVKKGAVEDGGVILVLTVEDSPARKAGLMPDDLITKVDGKDVKGLQEFVKTIRACKPGDTITLTIYRDGKEMDVKVKVGEAPAP
jgi:serine protease Do